MVVFVVPPDAVRANNKRTPVGLTVPIVQDYVTLSNVLCHLVGQFHKIPVARSFAVVKLVDENQGLTSSEKQGEGNASILWNIAQVQIHSRAPTHRSYGRRLRRVLRRDVRRGHGWLC